MHLFIHVGEDVVIRSSDVVAILDWQLVEDSEQMIDFIERHRANDNIIDIGLEYTKSIVITTEEVYLSPLASLTLKRRALTVAEFDLVEDELNNQ